MQVQPHFRHYCCICIFRIQWGGTEFEAGNLLSGFAHITVTPHMTLWHIGRIPPDMRRGLRLGWFYRETCES